MSHAWYAPMTYSEAMRLTKRFMNAYPSVKKWAEQIRGKAMSKPMFLNPYPHILNSSGTACEDGTSCAGAVPCPACKWVNDRLEALRRAEADELLPEGCKCDNNGGGDCDWCLIFYGWED
jgi:hypothetical protein